jgi:hypothetical protein
MAQNINQINVLCFLNTITTHRVATWYRRSSHGIDGFNAIDHATKGHCLPMPKVASSCQPDKEKSPQ